MNSVEAFLAESPVFSNVPREQLGQVAALAKVQTFSAGSRILEQGGYSHAVYFVRSGRLVVRVRRGHERETVAYLQPPDLFGELSCFTGRPCVADVDVEVDAEVVFIEKESFNKLPENRDQVLRGLMMVIAQRLQSTISTRAQAPELPIVLLRLGPNFEAPRAFPALFAKSLAAATGRNTLLATIGGEASEQKSLDAATQAVGIGAKDTVRAQVAEALTGWKRQFDDVILCPAGPQASTIATQIREFSNWEGALLGPGDAVPTMGETSFVAQSATRPTLAVLDGKHQLVWEVQQAEENFAKNLKSPARFQRTVDSLARAIAGTQVGLSLGGGAAWGWAHIGVLEVLEQGGIPIDVISGCSMGSVIGAFRGFGWSIEQLLELAAYWNSRTKRFIEWRLWKMCLLNEGRVKSTFEKYFNGTTVNQTQIPYWANAVDIQAGKEFTIRDGTLVDCVRASIALPGLLPPANRGSAVLVDAGIMDPVPLPLIQNMGAHFTIAVNAMAKLESRPVSPHYPLNAFDVMTRAMFLMGHEIGQARVEQGANVAFTPTLDGIGMLQFNRSAEIIDRGREATRAQLPTIQTAYAALKERWADATKKGEPKEAEPRPLPQA